MLHVLAYGIHVHQLIAQKNSPTHIPRRNVAAAFLGTDGWSPCPQGGCTKTFADPQTAKKHYHKVHLGIRYPCSSDDCQKNILRTTHCEATLPPRSPRH